LEGRHGKHGDWNDCPSTSGSLPADKQAKFERASQAETGGKPEELSHYWQAATKPLEQPRKLWYDDKDVPDEDEIPA